MGTALVSKSVLVVVVALAATSVKAATDCDPRVFMVQDVQAIQESGETELAFVLTATEQEFDKAKSGAGASLYGLLSLNYQEAQEKARAIAQATKFDYKSSYAASYFSQTLSPTALQAYVQCLNHDNGSPGLRLWLNSRQGDFFTFEAFWVGADTKLPSAKYDAPPLVDGGTVVSKPDVWLKAKTEEIVVKRNGNDDLFLNLKVGGEVKSDVIVKDPPAVVWKTTPVTSGNLIKTASHGPNPGCSAGQVTDCIYPTHPGGSFVPKSAAMTERSSSDPSKYSEVFKDTPAQICVTMTESTGACENSQSAQGRLTAIEKYPEAAQ